MRQVLCISGQRWLTVPNRTQQLMSRLEDAQILFFEPPASAAEDWKRPGRKVRQNVIVHTLPPELTQNAALRLLSRVSAGRTVKFIQERLDRVRFTEPLLWCSSPAGAEFMEELPHRGVVYDCYRDWPEYPESWESELAVNADVCFAASPDLLRHLAPCNGNVTLLPNGCNYPMFAKDNLPRPGPLRRTQAPLAGPGPGPPHPGGGRPLELRLRPHRAGHGQSPAPGAALPAQCTLAGAVGPGGAARLHLFLPRLPLPPAAQRVL